jgi:hypothetical protein
MNWFVGVAGTLYLGAAIVYFYQGKIAMGITFVAYTVSNFALMWAAKG